MKSLRCRLDRHDWESLLYLGKLTAVERLGVRIPQAALPFAEVCSRCLAVRDTRNRKVRL